MARFMLGISLIFFIFLTGGYYSMHIEAKAEDFPERTINMIVAFGAGGGADLQARTMEKFIGQEFGKGVMVTNKPGAGGVIGWNELSRARTDGYTIGITATDILLHTLYTPNETHYFTMLDPIAQVTSTPYVLVVNAEMPWQNVAELVQYAKEHPQELKYGHAGIGSTTHIAGALFGKLTDTEVVQVPFKSGSESLAALLGKHIQFAFINPATIKDHVKVGSLRAIAVTGDKRIKDPVLANVPTLKERGIDMVFTIWMGVAAPKELPPVIKKRLEDGFKRIVAEPEFQENMAKLGLEVEYLNSYDSQTRWIKEIKELKKMLEDTGIIEEVRALRKS